MVIIAHCRKASILILFAAGFSTPFNQHQLLRTPSNQVTDTCDVSACRTDQRISRASKFPTWWDSAALAFLVGRKQGAAKVDFWSTTYILRHVDMKPESHLQQRFLEHGHWKPPLPRVLPTLPVLPLLPRFCLTRGCFPSEIWMMAVIPKPLPSGVRWFCSLDRVKLCKIVGDFVDPSISTMKGALWLTISSCWFVVELELYAAKCQGGSVSQNLVRISEVLLWIVQRINLKWFHYFVPTRHTNTKTK